MRLGQDGHLSSKECPTWVQTRQDPDSHCGHLGKQPGDVQRAGGDRSNGREPKKEEERAPKSARNKTSGNGKGRWGAKAPDFTLPLVAYQRGPHYSCTDPAPQSKASREPGDVPATKHVQGGRQPVSARATRGTSRPGVWHPNSQPYLTDTALGGSSQSLWPRVLMGLVCIGKG